jgi:simple sugar transport system substrate-binding protein
VAEFIVNNKLKGKVGGSGWDTGLPVMDAIESGSLLQTVDQQAYLQGFDTLMQLFLYNISGGLMAPTDTNTGTAIVVKATVGSYLKASRWEGTAPKETVGTAPKPIPY